LNFSDEFTDVFKLTIDGYVAHVSYGIDVVQFCHDAWANTAGGNFRKMIFVKFSEDFLYGTIETIHGDWTFLTGFDKASEYFFSVERFTSAVTFNDLELSALNLLVGGVTIVTC